MLIRRAIPVAMMAIAAAILTACTSSGGFGDLDREAQDNDRLPQDVSFTDVGIVAESSRLVGIHEGAELWLVRTVSDGVCLVAYLDDAQWGAGCGDNTPLSVGGSAGSFTVIRDGEDPPDSATQISENVFAG